MERKYEIAGEVMGFFDSFKGSRPALDNDGILIVRGRSRKIIPTDEFDAKLDEIGQILGAAEVKDDPDRLSEILKIGDKHIKSSEANNSDVDESGFMRMKEELEAMGLIVAYKVFELPGFDVIIAIWQDKHEIPPLYVEVTVSQEVKA